MSSCYKKIEKSYPVYSGAEFWKHLTGDEHFYSRLSKAFGEVVEEENIDGSQIIIDKIKEIAEEIKKRGGI